MKMEFRTIPMILVSALSLVLIACDKDDLTKPATVTLKINTVSESVMDGKINIDRFEVNLDEIDISGRRTNENDMFFTREFSVESGHFNLIQSPDKTSTLQIPQGVYESLVFYTSIREEDFEFELDADGDDDETNDLKEYVERARPGILLTGHYVNADISFPVIIALNDDVRRLALDASQNEMSTIVLKNGTPSQATMAIDPRYWFTSVTTEMLEAATTFAYGDTQALLISEEYNENIYNQIAARIESSVILTVEDQ